ncbi:hypothetical protein BT93_L0726 [Corymbia citriodora subsp. variegata]|uniref:Uncharacterized protein n=1 Tax=Corymbia citriodora subsp. variegata TaxID=360336 RepID=A0A8T0CU55_CORYI|nr:hypothetical protein BT93_L0726 [Corymbia citriodora subsp. variegata]
MSIFSLVTGRPGPSGFGSATTAEQVTEGIDASDVTAIVTGELSFFSLFPPSVLIWLTIQRNSSVVILLSSLCFVM